MSSMILNGDTSGAITVTVPAVAGTNTATLPAATGTVMVSGNMPAFSAYMSSSTQSVTTGTFTKVQLNAKTFDTANCYDATTNYRFTPNVAGYYQVNGLVGCSASSATIYIATIYKNGAEFCRGNDLRGSSGFMTLSSCTVSSLIYLNGSTDYIELYGYIAGTSPLFNGTSMTGGSYFQASMVRAA